MGSKEEIPLASLDQKIGTFQTVTRYAQFASDANIRARYFSITVNLTDSGAPRGFGGFSIKVLRYGHIAIFTLPLPPPSVLGDHTLIIWILDH